MPRPMLSILEVSQIENIEQSLEVEVKRIYRRVAKIRYRKNTYVVQLL